MNQTNVGLKTGKPDSGWPKTRKLPKTGKFAGHIRPEKGKHDLDQNNVWLKTGKFDFVWPKTGKRVGHIRPKKGNMI